MRFVFADGSKGNYGRWECAGNGDQHSAACDIGRCKERATGRPAILVNQPYAFTRGQGVIVAGSGGGQWRGFVRWQSIANDTVTVQITHAPDDLSAVAREREFPIGQVTPCDLSLAACLAGRTEE